MSTELLAKNTKKLAPSWAWAEELAANRHCVLWTQQGMLFTMSSTDERRGSARIPFASVAVLCFDQKEWHCRTRDIGNGGLFVYFDDKPLPPLGAKVQLKLSLGGESELLKMDAIVARHEAGSNGVGVAFVTLNEVAQEALSNFVD